MMNGRTKRWAFLAVLVVLGSVASSGAAAQTVATARLMRAKLGHAQKLLEAVTTSNYALLEQESQELSRLTNDAAWMVLKTPEYRRQSDVFLRVSQDLLEAARKRDLDLAAMHYVSLTMSCYQCHRYIKNMRLAQR